MREITTIGVAGGSGSGKTTFALALQRLLGQDRCAILHQDAYYHDQGPDPETARDVNFDHPDAVDFGLLLAHLDDLRAGRSVQVPVYDYRTHRRLGPGERLKASPVILVEGLLVLSQPPLRACLDTKVFIAASEPVRYARRLSRDALERGRHPAGIEEQFLTQVKPMHDRFVEPSRVFADNVYSGEGAIEDGVRDLVSRLGLLEAAASPGD